MKVVLVLMDTLRKDFLKSYNKETFVATPHIDAFAGDATTFDHHYIGSTPCMPARRDIMTGRLNFLERSWGPIEPYDITVSKVLQQNGIYSHLTTDHTHYFRLGGEGYINQYTTWDFQRGQEGDPWISHMRDPEWMPEQYYGKLRRQYQANRVTWHEDEEKYPTPRTFKSACAWLEDNQHEDNFFLQVEVFDPHEPFDVPSKYMTMYDETYTGPYFETPNYGEVDVPEEAVAYIRRRYAALMTMTDVQGKSWLPLIEGKDNHKDYAVYGAHGITVNITDGQYTYFRAPNTNNAPLYEYAGIPTTIRHYLGEQNPENIEMGRFLKRTKFPVYKVPIKKSGILDGLDDVSHYTRESLLFNIENDKSQQHPLKNEQIEHKMKQALIEELIKLEAPKEQFERLSLLDK